MNGQFGLGGPFQGANGRWYSPNPNGPPQEIAINTLPFWSRFTITVDLQFTDATGLTRQIINSGRKIPVFDYRKGEQNVTALEGARATARDTILVQANQTRGGGIFKIYGLSFTKDGWPYVRSGVDQQNGTIHDIFPPSGVQPGNGGFGPQVMTVEDFRSIDAMQAHIFLDNFRTEIKVDGTRRILEMGPAQLYPGVGGTSGNNVDTQNGSTFVSNYMHITEGIVWNPAGAVDSNLQVELEATYDLNSPTWTAPDGAGVANPNPTAIGRKWTQGWIVNFHGVEESPTSNIS